MTHFVPKSIEALNAWFAGDDTGTQAFNATCNEGGSLIGSGQVMRDDYWTRNDFDYPYHSHPTQPKHESDHAVGKLTRKAFNLLKRTVGIEVSNAA